MGLEDRLNNPIGTLSGGQRQALTLLMSTWLKPKLLLLDEHTAALTLKVLQRLQSLPKKLSNRNNLLHLWSPITCNSLSIFPTGL